MKGRKRRREGPRGGESGDGWDCCPCCRLYSVAKTRGVALRSLPHTLSPLQQPFILSASFSASPFQIPKYPSSWFLKINPSPCGFLRFPFFSIFFVFPFSKYGPRAQRILFSFCFHVLSTQFFLTRHELISKAISMRTWFSLRWARAANHLRPPPPAPNLVQTCGPGSCAGLRGRAAVSAEAGAGPGERRLVTGREGGLPLQREPELRGAGRRAGGVPTELQTPAARALALPSGRGCFPLQERPRREMAGSRWV